MTSKSFEQGIFLREEHILKKNDVSGVSAPGNFWLFFGKSCNQKHNDPSKGPQTGVKSGRRRGGGGGGRVKNQKIMFFHSFFNESLAETRLKAFRQLR